MKRNHTLSATGFTLIEILLAMGITVFTLIVLFSLMAQAVRTAADSKADSVAVFIADAIRSKLVIDPDWPPGSADKPLTATSTFSSDLFYDDQGTETIAKSAFYKATLNFTRSPNYQSARLDFINLEIRRVGKDRVLSSFSLQRARQTARKES